MERLERSLPPLLAVIAGMVDVLGWVSLDHLFTAHITGNLVVISADLVQGHSPHAAQVLAIPVFMIAVACTWMIARRSARSGPPLMRLLLLVHFLLLAFTMMASVSRAPGATTFSWVIAMTAVAAMGCQFALLRLTIPHAPSTSVMTGNLTNGVISALDAVSLKGPKEEEARVGLTKTTLLLVGFIAGCVAGAGADLLLGHWSWSIPAALSAAALATSTRA
jgi:uncharacterized membrane protein YoaK (UPF0700 family)